MPSLQWRRHWVQVNRFLALVAIVSFQQVAVILASNVGLTSSGCCATAGVSLLVERLFFAPECFCWQVLITCLV